MNMRDYPTIHLDSNKKKVATFVLLFHEHLTLWDQYSVIFVCFMPMAHTIHSVVRHYRIVRRVWRYQRGKSESAYRRTENTMATRKKNKRTNNTLQNIYIKLKIELHEPHLKPGWTQVLRQCKQFLLHYWHHVTFVILLNIVFVNRVHQLSKERKLSMTVQRGNCLVQWKTPTITCMPTDSISL
jgi:hypothetical protein